MSLNILVCIKQVPHPEHFSEISLDPVSQRIIREGVPAIINPLDRHAIEEGLRIRERFAGKVTAVSMGPPEARDALEEALAMGVDDAVLLCDPAFAAADTLATAYALACAITKLSHSDLILCGNESVDGATGQVGPQIAEFLAIPHVTFVEGIDFANGESLAVRRAMEYGYMRVKVELPALLAVTSEINRPRLPTVWGIMEATSKEIKVWTAGDIGADHHAIGLEGSPTRVVGIFHRQSERKCEIMDGSSRDAVKKAVGRLRELPA